VTRPAAGGGARDPRLAAVLGAQRPVRFNARRVAALADNPGCQRRTVLDVARVPMEDLSGAAGVQARFGQSPFAIDRGNRFEIGLKRGSNYDRLFEVLHDALGLPPDRFSVRDLSDPGGPARESELRLQRRARETRRVIRSLLIGDPRAPAVLDHPVLTLAVAGEPVFLEPDALAVVAVGSEIILVEIKSFPEKDGVVPRDKAGAAARQVAVYAYALRQMVEALGHDPSVISTNALLVTPVNTTTAAAVGNRLPIGAQLATLKRQLSRVIDIGVILRRTPPGFTLDWDAITALLPADSGQDMRAEAVAAELRRLPANYVPRCRAQCSLGEFCHREAMDAGDPAVVGTGARDALAGIRDLRQASRIAAGQPLLGDTAEPDVTVALRRAYRVDRAARAVVRVATGIA
jgi:hypothetical protein